MARSATQPSDAVEYPALEDRLQEIHNIPEDRRKSVLQQPTAPKEDVDSLWTVRNQSQFLHQVDTNPKEAYTEFVTICEHRDLAISVVQTQEERMSELQKENDLITKKYARVKKDLAKSDESLRTERAQRESSA